MAKLELQLLDKNGDMVTYTQDKVTGERVLDFWDLQEKTLQEGYTPKQNLLDRVAFLASLFDAKAVTPKAILRGLNAWELEEVVDGLIMTAMGVERVEDPKEIVSALEKESSVS